MPILHFDPVARLQRFLGRELIADPNVAVAEFVKNAYDAGATDVLIAFEINQRAREQQRVTITDNGTGMNSEYFEQHWMRPGYSAKADQSSPVPKDALAGPAELAKQRVPIGEKGLGRLAAARLADRLHVFTRPRREQPWLHVYIDWETFDTMDKSIREIDIPVDFDSEPDNPRFETGTIVLLERLSLNWAASLPGRKSPDRASHRLGRLREDLSILLQPLPAISSQFRIYLQSNSPNLAEYNGWVEPASPLFHNYRFDFRVVQSNGQIVSERRLTRSSNVAEQVGKSAREEMISPIEELRMTEDEDGDENTLKCGPFSGSIFYAPSITPRLKELGVFPGVLLYRDGVRVDPYGVGGNDWLEATAWKAARQGHAPIQPRHLTGHIVISKRDNPELRDMTNRQGLIDSPAYRAFLTLAREEFRWFGNLIYSEYLQSQWEPPEVKAQRDAERVQRLGRLIIRALAHSIRQSTAGLGAELRQLRRIADDNSLQDAVANGIRLVESRARGHVNNIDSVVERFVALEDQVAEEIEEFDLADLVRKAVSDLKPIADSFGVELVIEEPPLGVVVFNRQVLLQALNEVGVNGIEAASAASRPRKFVRFTVARTRAETWEITIADNGSGVPSDLRPKLFLEPVSNKGRPGIGLTTAKELLALSGGDLLLDETSEEGTQFKITLPTRRGW